LKKAGQEVPQELHDMSAKSDITKKATKAKKRKAKPLNVFAQQDEYILTERYM